MIYTVALGTTIIAMAGAIFFERVVSHFQRENVEDAVHNEEASAALQELVYKLKELLDDESIPLVMKEHLIELSTKSLDEDGAHALLDALDRHDPILALADVRKKGALDAAALALKLDNPAALHRYASFIRALPIVSFMQRSETTKAMGSLALRVIYSPFVPSGDRLSEILDEHHGGAVHIDAG